MLESCSSSCIKYLANVVAMVESGELESRTGIKELEETLAAVTSRNAMNAAALHGIEFGPVWPRLALERAANDRLRNFVKHRLPG